MVCGATGGLDMRQDEAAVKTFMWWCNLKTNKNSVENWERYQKKKVTEHHCMCSKGNLYYIVRKCTVFFSSSQYKNSNTNIQSLSWKYFWHDQGFEDSFTYFVVNIFWYCVESYGVLLNTSYSSQTAMWFNSIFATSDRQWTDQKQISYQQCLLQD